MPYLQLDVNGHHPVADKKRLARQLSETYARMMSVDIRREPVEVSVLMCDIRRGRSAELRLDVAKALCRDCIDILGLREDRLNVEFTQHSGDEMYHPTLGGYSPEWSEDESPQ